MDILYTKPLRKNAYTVLRDAGYIPIFDRASGKQSFVNKMTGARYPRFHIYVEAEADQHLKLHLHLDQKAHGWGEKLHDSEYSGARVRAEAERLARWLMHHT